MSEMKHTPHPWIVDQSDESDPKANPVICGGKNGQMPVAEILGPLADEDGLHRGHYDMRLIQAAPTLLEACLLALPHLVNESAANAVRDAIARATGKCRRGK